MEIKNQIISIYKRFSPSVRKVSEQSNQLRHSMFMDRLKLPVGIFSDARILEFGPGAGETSIYYARWGGMIEFVEINPDSCKMLRDKFHNESLSNHIIEIHNSDFEFFSPQSQREYDFVCAEGCLYLVDNPEDAFGNLVKKLKLGGFVMVAIPETLGSFQKILKALLLHNLSGGNEERIVVLAKELFKEDLERAHKAGGRPIHNIIYDEYIMPKLTTVPADEVLRWFHDNNIRYYSSMPNLETMPLYDSEYQSWIDLAESSARSLVGASKLFHAKAKEYDKERIEAKQKDLLELNKYLKEIESVIMDINLNDVDVVDLPKVQRCIKKMATLNYESIFSPERDVATTFSKFINETLILIALLNNLGNFEAISEAVNSFEILFRGFSGQSSQYYVGYRVL